MTQVVIPGFDQLTTFVGRRLENHPHKHENEVPLTLSVKEYLFNARKVIMDPATSPTLLLDVIRQGNMISPGSVSWAAVCAVVQMCVIGGHGDRLKALIGVHYDAAKSRDDKKDMRRLSQIAQMFGEHAFEEQISDPTVADALARWAHRAAPDDTPFAE